MKEALPGNVVKLQETTIITTLDKLILHASTLQRDKKPRHMIYCLLHSVVTLNAAGHRWLLGYYLQFKCKSSKTFWLKPTFNHVEVFIDGLKDFRIVSGATDQLASWQKKLQKSISGLYEILVFNEIPEKFNMTVYVVFSSLNGVWWLPLKARDLQSGPNYAGSSSFKVKLPETEYSFLHAEWSRRW